MSNNFIARYFRSKNSKIGNRNFGPGLSPKTPSPRPYVRALTPKTPFPRTPISLKPYKPLYFSPRKIKRFTPSKQNLAAHEAARIALLKMKKPRPNFRNKRKKYSPFIQIFNGKVSSILESPILVSPPKKNKTPSPKKTPIIYNRLNTPPLKTPPPKRNLKLPNKVTLNTTSDMTLTSYGDNKINFFQNLLKKKGKKIGTESVYGSVYNLGKPGKYVLKHVDFDDDDTLKSFMNEIKVGSLPRIGEVGPCIYAYKIVMKKTKHTIGYGEYIMDHITKGELVTKFEDLNDYFYEKYKTFCPKLNNEPLLKQLRDVLLKFYTITKGFHGDLHGGNIFVITPKSGEPIVRIIDYGAFREFANKSNESCISKYLQKIYKNKFTNVSRIYGSQHNPKVLKFNSGGQIHTENASKNLIKQLASYNLKTRGTDRRKIVFNLIIPINRDLQKEFNWSKYVTNSKTMLSNLSNQNLENIKHNVNRVVGNKLINYKRKFIKETIINGMLFNRRMKKYVR